MGLKRAIQFIKQIWKLIHSQWIYVSKLKNSGEALDSNTKQFTHDAKITDETGQG